MQPYKAEKEEYLAAHHDQGIRDEPGQFLPVDAKEFLFVKDNESLKEYKYVGHFMPR